MCHVIIRTIPAVSYEDIGNPVRCLQAVHHGAESPEFILGMNGLDYGILISMCVKVIKGVEVYAVEPFCGMASGNKILFRGPLGGAGKGESRTVSRKYPVVGRGFQL